MTTVNKIDCKNLRVVHQKENNNTILLLLQNGKMSKLKKECNNQEVHRLLADLQIDEKELLAECARSALFAKAIARQISKKASRQGTKDKVFILQKCNETTSPAGIYIENLSTTAYRPTKDGRILTNKEYRESDLKRTIA